MAEVEGGSAGLDMRRLAEAPPPDVGPSSPPLAVSRSVPAADAAGAERRLSRQPYFNALLRTTCTPDRGGPAENALPQRATAWVNCRLLPDDSADQVRQALVERYGCGGKVTGCSQPSRAPLPLLPEVVRAVEARSPRVAARDRGADDADRGDHGRILRLAGIPDLRAGGVQDVSVGRAHGRDERIGIRQFRGRALLSGHRRQAFGGLLDSPFRHPAVPAALQRAHSPRRARS